MWEWMSRLLLGSRTQFLNESYWRDLLESPPSPDCSPESWTQSTLRSLHTHAHFTLSHTHTRACTHTHSSLSHTLFTLSLTQCLTHTLSHTLLLFTQTHALSLSTCTHTLSLSHTHSLSFSHTHTHTHKHTPAGVGGEDGEGHALSELLSDVLSQRRSGSRNSFHN